MADDRSGRPSCGLHLIPDLPERVLPEAEFRDEPVPPEFLITGPVSPPALASLAREHGGDAVAELARIMTEGTTDQARIAAAKEILDRGYGKTAQQIQVETVGHLPDAELDRRIRDAAEALADEDGFPPLDLEALGLGGNDDEGGGGSGGACH